MTEGAANRHRGSSKLRGEQAGLAVVSSRSSSTCPLHTEETLIASARAHPETTSALYQGVVPRPVRRVRPGFPAVLDRAAVRGALNVPPTPVISPGCGSGS